MTRSGSSAGDGGPSLLRPSPTGVFTHRLRRLHTFSRSSSPRPGDGGGVAGGGVCPSSSSHPRRRHNEMGSTYRHAPAAPSSTSSAFTPTLGSGDGGGWGHRGSRPETPKDPGSSPVGVRPPSATDLSGVMPTEKELRPGSRTSPRSLPLNPWTP